MRGHRGYNICPWLKNGKRETCGKSCREEYCKVHRFKIRNGSKIPNPCLGCGIGVRSQIPLCRGCGREKERQRLAKTRVEQASPEAPLEVRLGFLETAPLSFENSACAEECFDELPSWASERPDTYMLNDEFCFGMRD